MSLRARSHRPMLVMAMRGDVEYFDFVPDHLGRWENGHAWTLAAARFGAPGHRVTVLICGYREQWTTNEDKQVAQRCLIDRARQTLSGIVSRWPARVEEADLTAAFLVYGFRVAPPRGLWGEEIATQRLGMFPIA